MLTNKISKLFFCCFNDYLDRYEKPLERIRTYYYFRERNRSIRIAEEN